MTSFDNVYSSSQFLLKNIMGGASSKAHGVCMVAGWVGFSSCGQLIAKHYRGAFPKKKVAGKDFWFAVRQHFRNIPAIIMYEAELEKNI